MKETKDYDFVKVNGIETYYSYPTYGQSLMLTAYVVMKLFGVKKTPREFQAPEIGREDRVKSRMITYNDKSEK